MISFEFNFFFATQLSRYSLLNCKLNVAVICAITLLMLGFVAHFFTILMLALISYDLLGAKKIVEHGFKSIDLWSKLKNMLLLEGDLERRYSCKIFVTIAYCRYWRLEVHEKMFYFSIGLCEDLWSRINFMLDFFIDCQ